MNLVACGGICWYVVVSGSVVVAGGIWWYLVISGGIWWYVVVRAGVWWFGGETAKVGCVGALRKAPGKALYGGGSLLEEKAEEKDW